MRNIRTLIRLVAVVPALSFSVTGCFSLPKPNESNIAAASAHLKTYKDRIDADELHGAEQALVNARTLYTSSGALKGGNGAHFREEALTTALLADIKFRSGNITDAARMWNESFLIEKNGVSAEFAVNQKNAKGTDFLVNFMSAFAAGMNAQATGVPTTYQIQNTAVPSPELLSIGSPDGTVMRIPVRVESPPFDSIVKLITSRGTSCTATMLSRTLALSAAHCISPDGDPIKPEHIILKREGIFNSPRLIGSKYYTHLGENRGWQRDPRNDWVLIVTANTYDRNGPYPALIAMRTASEMINAQESLMLAGYSADLKNGHYLTLHYGCKIKQNTKLNGYYLSNCENSKGSSGAALMSASKPYGIIGIHTAELLEPKDEYTSLETSNHELIKTAQKLLNQ